MIIKAVHVVGNYIHFHAAFSLLCLLPTKEIISGGVAAEGKKLGAKPDTLRCLYESCKRNMQMMSSLTKWEYDKKSRLVINQYFRYITNFRVRLEISYFLRFLVLIEQN